MAGEHYCSACGEMHVGVEEIADELVEGGSDEVAVAAIEAVAEVAEHALDAMVEEHRQEEETEQVEAVTEAQTDQVEALADAIEEVAEAEPEPEEEEELDEIEPEELEEPSEPIAVAPPPREESADVKKEGGAKGRPVSAFSRRHRH